MSIEAPSQRFAVIDVGTNAVKILAADVSSDRFDPIHESSVQTRLGAGLYVGRRLGADAIRLTAETVADCSNEAERLGVVRLRCIATSAARDAANGKELIDAIKLRTGLETEVLSGEREAELAFQGVMTDPSLAQHSVIVVDVGGGSTEIVLGSGSGVECRRSLAMGTVRFAENFKTLDPPGLEALASCQGQVRKLLELEAVPQFRSVLPSRPSPGPILVAASGTSTVLARMSLSSETYDRAILEAVRLSRDHIESQCRLLWSVPLAERKKIIGLPPNRADIIPFGAAIIGSILAVFNCQELRISTRGLRFALLKEMAKAAS